MTNPICDLFKIKYPIVQGGMIWVSGAKLAAAVSNAGGLGIIGAGSMNPDVLREHILKAKALTVKPFGVNVPLLYEKTQEQLNTALELGVKIFFTSAGSPKKYTSYLKQNGAIVVHVTSSPELAQKCVLADVDAIVCEGFEAGGHNGREEITSMTLIPQVRAMTTLPLIAAGGIASGAGIAAALALGADGVQMGTRFLMTKESSAHENFKNMALQALPQSTQIMMRATVPVRLLNNHFAEDIKKIEETFTGPELKIKLTEHLGKFRAKKGILEGDLDQGELEIGQIVSLIKNISTVEEVMKELISDYQKTLSRLPHQL